MSPELAVLLEKIGGMPMYFGLDFSDINASSSDGDNALHIVAGWGDVAGAKLLIDAGIEIDKRGDRGYTPLHQACITGDPETVRLLADNGADLYALTEGDTPFMLARAFKHDHICDLLKPYLENVGRDDPNIWTRVRIAHLKQEVERLEGTLAQESDPAIPPAV